MRVLIRSSARVVQRALILPLLLLSSCGPKRPPASVSVVASALPPATRFYDLPASAVHEAVVAVMDRWEPVQLVTGHAFGYETSFIIHAGPRKGLLMWEKVWQARTKLLINIWQSGVTEQTMLVVIPVTEVRPTDSYEWTLTDFKESDFPDRFRDMLLSAVDLTIRSQRKR